MTDTAPPTLIADRIRAWYDLGIRAENSWALIGMLGRIGRRFISQFCSPPFRTKDRYSNFYTTGVSRNCNRYAWLKWCGEEEAPSSLGNAFSRWFGDLTEASLLAVAELAGVKILGNNRRLELTTEQGRSIVVKPDGWYEYAPKKCRNVSIKKIQEFMVESYQTKGVDDLFGWLTQASLEICAERASLGLDVDETEFLLFSPDSGSVLSILAPHSDELCAVVFHRVDGTEQGHMPERLAAVTNSFTGMKEIPQLCRFCGYRGGICWPEAQKRIEKFTIKKPVEKTVYVVPGEAKP